MKKKLTPEQEQFERQYAFTLAAFEKTQALDLLREGQKTLDEEIFPRLRHVWSKDPASSFPKVVVEEITGILNERRAFEERLLHVRSPRLLLVKG